MAMALSTRLILSRNLCAEPASVWYSFINGQPIIEQGCLKGVDEKELTQQVQLSVANLLAAV